jgi:hypothetical protein
MRSNHIGVAIILVAAAFSCSKSGGVSHAAGAEGLKALFEKMVAAAKEGKLDRVGEVVRSLIPTKADLNELLRPEWVEKIAPELEGQMGKMRELDAVAVARSFGLQPDRSQIDVYKTTTEELASYEKGSMAWEKFAGGARRVAQKALQPRKELFAVEMREPGHRLGTKYQLFAYANGHWALLGKLWRSVR